jgi:hypothetical protein
MNRKRLRDVSCSAIQKKEWPNVGNTMFDFLLWNFGFCPILSNFAPSFR